MIFGWRLFLEVNVDEKRITELELRLRELQSTNSKIHEQVAEYLRHDYWRCGWFKACQCGLDAATDALQWPRVPLPDVSLA